MLLVAIAFCAFCMPSFAMQKTYNWANYQTEESKKDILNKISSKNTIYDWTDLRPIEKWVNEKLTSPAKATRAKPQYDTATLKQKLQDIENAAREKMDGTSFCYVSKDTLLTLFKHNNLSLWYIYTPEQYSQMQYSLLGAKTLLLWACQNLHIELIEHLLAQPNTTSEYINTPMKWNEQTITAYEIFILEYTGRRRGLFFADTNLTRNTSLSLKEQKNQSDSIALKILTKLQKKGATLPSQEKIQHMTEITCALANPIRQQFLTKLV